MLACVYPPESFKSKAVTIKVRHGKSRRKAKIVSIKGKSDKSSATSSHNELPVGGGGAVLVLSELESMAARQQREIAQQRRLLEQREARLAVLRGTQEPAHQEKLARLRHRLDQQQSKLNRLRLLRSQTDQSRANNATLTSDLDCIRALFNEKEKELSLAVAKVEELTRQLEELRGRRNNAGAPGHIPTPASAELEKLRKELMYRNKMNEQQNQVVSQQRLALAQRQAEMASIDARIVQLQGRLQRKKALNQRMSQQLVANGRTPGGTGFGESKLDFNTGGKSRPAGNIAAIEPYSHIPNDNDFNLNKNDPKYQTLPYNTKFTVNFKTTDDDVNKNKIQHSASASQIGQRTTLQQFGHQIAHSQSQSHIQGQSQPLNNQQQNGSPNFTTGSQFLCNNNNNLTTNNNNNINNNNGSGLGAENQNLRLLQQKPQLVGPNGPNTLNAQQQGQMHRNSAQPTHQKPVSSVAPSFPVKSPIYQTSSTKIHPVMPQTLSLIGRGQSYPVQSQAQPNSPNGVTQEQNYSPRHNFVTTNSSNFTSGYPSHGFGQTQALPGSITTTTAETPNERLKFEPSKVQDKFDQMRFEPQNQQAGQQQRFEQFVKAENHVVPKYEQTTKPFEYDRLKSEADSKKQNFGEMKTEDKTKPALPPKPSKPNPPPRLTHHDKVETTNDAQDNKSPPGLSRLEKEEEIPPIPTSEPPESPTETQLSQPQQPTHQVIKARPLGLKKAPLFEQPKLRYSKSNIHVSINRRIEMPPAFLFPETEIPADLMQTEHQHQGLINDNEKTKKGLADELALNGTEKLEDSDIVDALNVINIEDKLKGKTEGCNERRPEIVEIDGVKAESVIRRKKGNLKSTTGKANLSRRVSFDPLALLLDASLEGELELVKKTAKEVANPSSANDEGITALHNAICAGHLEIVKFLVEFGCDVNAQDSDGWTPLHCAASCNNLAMVRFLVEHGACIFATTLSDQETAAEKCEEDEEGFDGCSEYLYSVQEKLGIMNSGQVYAVFDYEKQHSDELSLKNGDSLVILRKGDDNEREWWWSKLGNTEGYVPRNLLGLYPRVQPAQID